MILLNNISRTNQKITATDDKNKTLFTITCKKNTIGELIFQKDFKDSNDLKGLQIKETSCFNKIMDLINI
jgi:hypothetical protein